MNRHKVRCVTVVTGRDPYTLSNWKKLRWTSEQVMSNQKTSIPLQSKVSLTLVLLMAAFVMISYSILRSVIAPAFDELEMAAAKSDIHRAEAALRTDIENLQALTADWAPWDDIYYYVKGQNPGFEKSNLIRPTLDNLGLDMLAIYATESRFVWGQMLVGGEDVAVESLDILNPERPESAGITVHFDDLNRTVGFVQTKQGPMIVSSRPILRSDDSGPIAGAIVMGQFLNETRLARLRERTEVDLSWILTDSGSESSGVVEFQTGHSSILARKTLMDIHGAPSWTC